MRILSITAGAAGMYCGSCLRDNSLAIELMARGHEVTLLPLYTPTLTDEPNVSRQEVLFGGISIYLQQWSKLFRGSAGFVDRFLGSPRIIKAFAERSGSTDPHLLGDLTISMLEGRDGVLRKEFDKLIDWVAQEPLPDVINLPNSMLIGLAKPLAEAFGRPICCTLQGEELFLQGLAETYRERAVELIRAQVRHVDGFLAVSDYCAGFMSAYLQIPTDRLAVVPLGVNVKHYDRRPRTDDVFRIGFLARIAPEKGLHLLADAFQRLRRRLPDERVHLHAAGYLAPTYRSYLAEVRRSLESNGVRGEFTFEGTLDLGGKSAFLNRLDLLSVPAVYDEPKGLFLLEAMAAGIPTVQPRRGAFVEVVERTGGGILVDPDDAQSLSDGLEQLLRDPTRRRALGDAAYTGIRAHYSISRSADRLLAAYEQVVAGTWPAAREEPRLTAAGESRGH